MMEKFVTSLETAQALAAANFPLDTFFMWDRYNPNPNNDTLPQTAWRIEQSRRINDRICCIAAPTAEEIAEQLPDTLPIHDRTYVLTMDRALGKFSAAYKAAFGGRGLEHVVSDAPTIADALGKLWLELQEAA